MQQPATLSPFLSYALGAAAGTCPAEQRDGPTAPKQTPNVPLSTQVNLHKRIHKTAFKKRAPRAVKQIREFARKVMGTKDVRLDVKLNKAVWCQGIRNVPVRVRVVISRRRNDDEDAKVCERGGA